MGSDVLLLRVLFCLGLLTSACSSGKRTAMDQNLVAETPVETQVISVVQGRLSNWSYTDWDRRNRGEQLEVVWSTHNSPGGVLMKSRFSLGRVMLATLVGLMISSGPSWVLAGEQKKEGSEDVKERGVSPTPQGVIMQGNQLKAAPGYVLEKGGGNQMIARQKAGGGRMLTLDCGCQDGTGFCSLEVSGDVAICHRGASNPCSGTCGWTDVPSKAGKPQFR